MDYKEKAQAAAQEILTAFEEGTIPTALARMFIHRKNDVPARRWSFSNRLLAALRGHNDARGFRQWKEVGRFVKAGERSFSILVPRMGKAKEDDEQWGIKAGDPIVTGFVTAPVFGFSQIDGAPLPGEEEEASFIEALPVVEVRHLVHLPRPGRVLARAAGASRVGHCALHAVGLPFPIGTR